MIIGLGDIISIKHYSSYKTFKSVVVDVNALSSSSDMITIKLAPECAELNILEGDPVAITIQRNGNLYNTSCNVKEINFSKKTMRLLVENEDFIINKRAFERFPVSLYASVSKRDYENIFIAIVKNISFDGLMICSKISIEKGQSLDVKLHLPEQEIVLSALTMWKVENESIYDYGLKIVHMEYPDQITLKSYIEKIIQEQETPVNIL
jgi:hypothetical protein